MVGVVTTAAVAVGLSLKPDMRLIYDVGFSVIRNMYLNFGIVNYV
jgi:hypothetical protein